MLNYKRTCATFPHETTADQFFDDAQFESYRALGTHIAESTFGSWISDSVVRKELRLSDPASPARKPDQTGRSLTRAWIWDDLMIRHSPFRAAEEEDFQELTRELVNLEQQFLEKPVVSHRWIGCSGVDFVRAPVPIACGGLGRLAPS